MKNKTSKTSRSSKTTKSDGKVRLQKLLAAHGHGSRRACEEFILEGRVEVDGHVVNKLGAKVDPEKQKVTLDGERLVEQQLQYFILNKPPGVISTASDPSGRLRVIDLIKTSRRVYNVGRLDKSSEGLILVTNDGDLANKLTHPRYGVEKKYHVLVKGKPSRDSLEQLKRGIYLAEARVQVQNVRVKKSVKDRTWLEIILDEGRNREIRRILAKIGHKVFQLRRVAIGPLKLGDLPIGTHRRLMNEEVKRLKRFAGRPVKKPGRTKKKKKVSKSSTVHGRKKSTRKTVTGRKKSTARKGATGRKKSTARKNSGRKPASRSASGRSSRR